MELRAAIDGSSHTNDFFFSTFYIYHNLPFMNDDEGFVALFTRVSSSISCL